MKNIKISHCGKTSQRQLQTGTFNLLPNVRLYLLIFSLLLFYCSPWKIHVYVHAACQRLYVYIMVDLEKLGGGGKGVVWWGKTCDALTGKQAA